MRSGSPLVVLTHILASAGEGQKTSVPRPDCEFWGKNNYSASTAYAWSYFHLSTGPHQPGRYEASFSLASFRLRSSARVKSFCTSRFLTRRLRKSAQRNSLNGVVSLAYPPMRRSSPASERYGSSSSCSTFLGIAFSFRRSPLVSNGCIQSFWSSTNQNVSASTKERSAITVT